ncbi:MAG TPA: hypothetical protein VFG83_12770 [Kofleriaceae bacterium]|nr:hypothetical protein [Kofleriaceae bacterium]
MNAVVLERNKMIGRKIARVMSCAGLSVLIAETPEDALAHLAGSQVLAADAFDIDVVSRGLRDHEHLQGLLWTAEPMVRIIRLLKDQPRLSNVLSRQSFEHAPRHWELLMAARRLVRPDSGAPPLAGYLSWGCTGFKEAITDSAQIAPAVGKVQDFIRRLGAPGRISDMFGELSHELLMNAIYAAPADDHGRARFAHDRKAKVTLSAKEGALLRMASDGALLCIQVTDPFGRLERRHVVGGLARGLKDGTMDHTGGGAGLGMVLCHNATTVLICDVVTGTRTEVTGFFDLDLNLREFRSKAKSLHFFHAKSGGE